jgi:tRNA A58 N-methylase Trm61
MLIINILEWLLVIISLITFVLLWAWIFSGFNKKTKFTQISSLVFEDIDKNLDIKKGSIVFHLGCGDGRVLFYLIKQNPQARFIGVEDNKFLLSLARLKNWWNKIFGRNQVEFVKKDFFDYDLSQATHIFTYLYPNIMDDVLPKLDKELKKGTRLVSLNFHFTGKRSIAEIELKKRSYQLAKKIYIYEF